MLHSPGTRTGLFKQSHFAADGGLLHQIVLVYLELGLSQIEHVRVTVRRPVIGGPGAFPDLCDEIGWVLLLHKFTYYLMVRLQLFRDHSMLPCSRSCLVFQRVLPLGPAAGRRPVPLFMDSIALFWRVHPPLVLQRRNLPRTCGHRLLPGLRWLVVVQRTLAAELPRALAASSGRQAPHQHPRSEVRPSLWLALNRCAARDAAARARTCPLSRLAQRHPGARRAGTEGARACQCRRPLAEPTLPTRGIS